MFFTQKKKKKKKNSLLAYDVKVDNCDHLRPFCRGRYLELLSYFTIPGQPRSMKPDIEMKFHRWNSR